MQQPQQQQQQPQQQQQQQQHTSTQAKEEKTINISSSFHKKVKILSNEGTHTIHWRIFVWEFLCIASAYIDDCLIDCLIYEPLYSNHTLLVDRPFFLVSRLFRM